MDPLNFAIISPIMSKANIKPFFDCVDILNSFAKKMTVVVSTGENVSLERTEKYKAYHILSTSPGNKINRVLNYTKIQIKISAYLIKHNKDIGVSVFYMGDGLILPIVIEKIFKKKVVLILGGSSEEALSLNYDPLYRVILFFKRVNLKLSDCIVVYSHILVKKWKLEKYESKISIAHKHYVDFEKFNLACNYENRKLKIGFIGCISEIKGVFNFVQSIPKIIDMEKNVRFLIGGSGPLNKQIELYAKKNNINDFIEFVGWIPHDELPQHLNDLKLLVLPSYTEGLPNIVLESMACGTPVLATPVGAIPDIIKDGKTGFILKDNSIDCIVQNVICVLNDPNLNEISENGRIFIESKFSYAATVETFRNVVMKEV